MMFVGQRVREGRRERGEREERERREREERGERERREERRERGEQFAALNLFAVVVLSLPPPLLCYPLSMFPLSNTGVRGKKTQGGD